MSITVIPWTQSQLSQKDMMPKIVQLILFIVDSGCTKHMTGNLKRLCNLGEILEIFKGNDLLTGSRRSDLVQQYSSRNNFMQLPICFMSKASPTQAWVIGIEELSSSELRFTSTYSQRKKL
ncbi:hypothetical protein Tco_1055848 [Tanacetum coccineum]|uniref:Uncharacterized protein n=1 Tax=Tanacetum coccineum TaxID=301880 RepID=A0ABQ5H213_9ASTR